jgi:hypothetical protein
MIHTPSTTSRTKTMRERRGKRFANVSGVTKSLPPAPDITIVVAGVVMLFASTFGFYEWSEFGTHGSFSAWSAGLFFPVSIIPVLLGVIMAAQVAVSTYAPGVSIPSRPFGFSWDQLRVAAGAQATVMMLAFFVQRRAPFSMGGGFWLMLLAAIALLVGAVMRVREPGTRE